MSKTRLTALVAVLLVAVAALVVAGAAAAATAAAAANRPAPAVAKPERAVAANRSRSAPTSPIRRSSRGKPGELHRLRHRTDGSDRRKDRPRQPNSRTPRSTRSSATSARASSTPSPRPRRSPPNARRRSTSPTPTTSPNRRSWSKKAARSTRLEDLEGKTVGVQKGTTGQELGKEKADAGELRPYPEGPDAVNALKCRHGRSRRDRHPGRRERGRNQAAASKSPKTIPTEEEYGFAVAQGNTELLEEINEGLKEVDEDGTYATIYEKWFHHEPPKSIVDGDAQSELRTSEAQSDVAGGGAGDGAPSSFSSRASKPCKERR